MSQYQHLNSKLVPVWDRLHRHLCPQYNFSSIHKVFVDSITVPSEHEMVLGLHYVQDGMTTIVVDPLTFDKPPYQSGYTQTIIPSNKLLPYILLHEVCHYLFSTGQVKPVATPMDEEVYCDNFAFKHLKEMR